MRNGDIKPLSETDQRHLLAAQGWVELGNHIEADSELDKIVNEYRVHPDVLEVRWAIYASQKQLGGMRGHCRSDHQSRH